MLVPEIALTPQTVARFAARFGDTVALLHSALSEGERYDEWRRLRSGEARIAVGPRSAVFAPVERLGLIVVDEEHDASYKHEGDPRYDARHVAAYRAYQSGARLLAGSATPRPETVHRTHAPAAARRAWPAARDLPPVRVLDMRESQHPLHPETRRALTSARKSIVLLNRRGWSNFLTCKSCGKAWECPRCEVALVLHRAERALACHHCGHREPIPSPLRHLRLAGRRPPRRGHRARRGRAARRRSTCPVFRLDADTAPDQGRRARSCSPASTPRPPASCSARRWWPRATTSPDVTLGVVLDADSTLRFPDFRAEERTFALIAQLAGRAGRGPQGGRVLVQTRSPNAPSIEAAARHDADGFLAGELERRRALRYPPFADLIRVVTSALDRGTRARRRGRDRRGHRRPADRAPRPRAAVPPARPRALPARAQDRPPAPTRSPPPAPPSRPPRATRRSAT